MQFKHTEFDDSVNRSDVSPVREFARYLVAAALVVIMIFVVLGALVDWSGRYITPQHEAAMAEYLVPDALLTTQSDNKTLTAQQHYVQSVLDGLVKNSTLPEQIRYRAFVLEDKTPNAFALPGGIIVVHTGLIDTLESENALAFVLGHELGHFVHRHHLQRMGRAVVVMALSLFMLGESESRGKIIATIIDLTSRQHTRAQESEADSTGLQLLVARYGHASGATEFFAALSPLLSQSKWLEFAQTHPVSLKRTDHLRNLIDENGYPHGKTTPLSAF